MIKTLEDFKAYNLAMDLGAEAWAIVVRWGRFEQDAVGKQFVRAVDSIAANLSEGLGRYHFRESRGSRFETKTWLTRALNGKLVGPPFDGSRNPDIPKT